MESRDRTRRVNQSQLPNAAAKIASEETAETEKIVRLDFEDMGRSSKELEERQRRWFAERDRFEASRRVRLPPDPTSQPPER